MLVGGSAKFMLIGALFFFEASSFRIPREMCGIGLALLLPELRPQVCYPVRRGLASVAPNGGPGGFVGLG